MNVHNLSMFYTHDVSLQNPGARRHNMCDADPRSGTDEMYSKRKESERFRPNIKTRQNIHVNHNETNLSIMKYAFLLVDISNVRKCRELEHGDKK